MKGRGTKMAGLTEDRIRNARSGDGERILWDGKLPGFGCRILPGGTRTLFLQFRAGRKNRRKRLARWIEGRQGQVEAARRKAIKLLDQINDGIDPVEQERAQRLQREKAQANTLADAARRFIKQQYTDREAKSAGEMQRIWECIILPELGARPVSEITRGDVTALLDKVEVEARNPERGW